MPKAHYIFLGALLLAAPLAAAPYLVKDLNRGPADPAGAELFESGDLGGVLYFSASDPAHGAELWRSDGNIAGSAGTYRVTDVCPGRCSSSPNSIGTFHDRLYWSADDGVAGRELWTSDGVPGHEQRVKDICAGPCDSSPQGFAVAADRLLFFALLGRRLQLWASDGTAAGTTRIATLCTLPEVAGPRCFVSPLRSIGDRVLFEIHDTANSELWESDGTAAGTFPLKRLVSDLPPTASGPIVAGSFAYFWTADDLWRTDGTAAGTVRIRALSELAPQAEGLERSIFRVAVAGGLLYTVLGSGDMIRSDGTPAGTFPVGKFPDGFDVRFLTPLADRLVFETEAPIGPPRPAIWVSRGTPESTVQVADLARLGSVDTMTSLGDRAVFRLVRTIDANSIELWVTDGTPAGTARLVAGLGTTPIPNDLVSAGGRAFFLQPSPEGAGSNVLWTADGTLLGTHPVRDFGAVPASSDPLDQVAFGDRLLFTGRTGPVVAPLFVSDGTADGTVPLSQGAQFATGFTPVAGRLFFTAGAPELQIPSNPPFRDGLWRTDGTPAGTIRVAEVLGFAAPKRLGNDLFFTGAPATGFGLLDSEPWVSDGTARRTRMVTQINPFEADTGRHHICVGAASAPGVGVLLGDRVLFAADDGVHGRELWASDGTAKGTRLVADINPLRSPTPPPMCDDPPDGRTDSGLPSNPDDFVRLGNGKAVLFAADDGTSGRELWRSDGTTRGTRRVADLRPGPFGSSPHDLTRLGDTVYFLASVDGPGEALLRTDGTARGTVLVSDLKLNGTPSWGRSLTVSGGRLYFVVYNELIGAELWVSDGTAASTRIVADLKYAAGSSAPQNLTDVGGVLLFAADDGLTGLELWRSDGTGAGTFQLGDLNPGPAASSPGPFTVVGDRVFFGADDGVHGRELWAIPVADVVAP
jgi:ELWxxDGT repeat protein